ncbi:DUF222 domain-containing protein, partial [Paenibacillus glucanolyticus]|uniref:DUF222 domain-containing protein n=1 Tax=Paenibacillus glucanolyticus TaxID=59843 RepID=UPI0036645A8D
TMSLDQLRADLGTAALGYDGDQITAAEARRLACNADLVPAVLGTNSEVLDLGRTARLAHPIQHRALRLRDQGCQAEDCDAPAAWWLSRFELLASVSAGRSPARLSRWPGWFGGVVAG